MSESLNVCQALAAMVRVAGDPTEEEVRFVGHAAFDLGLSAEENGKVQATLKQGGDFATFVAEVKSRPMRHFLFRRVVAASLLDEQINDSERALIQQTARAFGYEDPIVEELVAWMQEGIAWEKRGAELFGRL
jgi:hypothetical protein